MRNTITLTLRQVATRNKYGQGFDIKWKPTTCRQLAFKSQMRKRIAPLFLIELGKNTGCRLSRSVRKPYAVQMEGLIRGRQVKFLALQHSGKWQEFDFRSWGVFTRGKLLTQVGRCGRKSFGNGPALPLNLILTIGMMYVSNLVWRRKLVCGGDWYSSRKLARIAAKEGILAEITSLAIGF